MIPGPSEPSVTEIHHYLEPMVSGFAGHAAKNGCYRCTRKFETFPNNHPMKGDCINFSGFDRVYPRLDNEMHKQLAFSWRDGSKAEQTRIFAEYRIRYSPLLKLPYMDLIRFTVIDPMHNLYLGTAKRMTHYWTDVQQHDAEIQEIIDTNPPSDIGRIPRKITAGFSSFTADQWRNWILLYSTFCLRNYLPHNYRRYWQMFVCANALWGIITPNMHMHTHLHECLEDYGPIYGFRRPPRRAAGPPSDDTGRPPGAVHDTAPCRSHEVDQ
ncbi:7875_t:CDS:2 [Ambispora leptoticha]|uniref:7875_t:CDS:1 n=1 Tax=Ambispora leptoticha TaxID=144679 RepID=A0A9N8VBH5_9GLOM|nr:7875_t:CDS:2 [Ambispora leptoticha]